MWCMVEGLDSFTEHGLIFLVIVNGTVNLGESLRETVLTGIPLVERMTLWPIGQTGAAEWHESA